MGLFLKTDHSLSLVSGMGFRQRRRLRDAGIETLEDLGSADLANLARRVPFPVPLLVDWMDEALAITFFSLDREKIKKSGQFGLKISALEWSLESPEASLSSEKVKVFAGLLHFSKPGLRTPRFSA
jgi:hypothetical protein